jgi:hypothetical protein
VQEELRLRLSYGSDLTSLIAVLSPGCYNEHPPGLAATLLWAMCENSIAFCEEALLHLCSRPFLLKSKLFPNLLIALSHPLCVFDVESKYLRTRPEKPLPANVFWRDPIYLLLVPARGRASSAEVRVIVSYAVFSPAATTI